MVSEVEFSDTDPGSTSQVSEAGDSQALPTDDGGKNIKPSDRPDSGDNPDKNLSELSAINERQFFSCTECGLVFRKQDDFDRHRFAHTGVKEYRCPEPNCTKEYTNRSHLNRHIRTNHHSTKEFASNQIQCKHASCAKTFSTEQNMRRHYDHKHVLGKSWTCDKCGERFWRKLQLKQHLFRHTGEYPHRCDHCNKGFMNLKSLRHHQTSHAIYKCDSCTSEFTRWTDLVAHRKLQHMTVYQCDICQGKFRSKRNLKAHILVHQKSRKDGEEQVVFQCPYDGCPKFYDYERNLMAHVKSKHEGVQKYVCSVEGCGRALSTQQKLDQHRRMHESAARSVPRMKMPGKPPARRKDAGQQRRSTASRLANIRLEPQVERVLIDQSPDRRPTLELEGSFSMDSASESEVESSAVVTTVLQSQLARIQEQIKQMQEQSGQS